MKQTFPDSQIMYDLSHNSHHDVIKQVMSLDCLLGVSSIDEILWARDLGIDSKKLVNIAVVKSQKTIEKCSDMKVENYIFDNEFELEKFDWHMKLILKIKWLEDLISFEQDKGAKYLELLKNTQLKGLDVVGISINVN